MNKMDNERHVLEGKTKHTPGPWKWKRVSSENWLEGQRIFLVGADEHIVLQPTIVSGDECFNDLPVTIFGRSTSGDFLEDLADYLDDEIIDHPDANLIASAPDMAAEIERLKAVNAQLLEAAKVGVYNAKVVDRMNFLPGYDNDGFRYAGNEETKKQIAKIQAAIDAAEDK